MLDEIIHLKAPGRLICAARPQTLFSTTWTATAPTEARGGRAWVLPADARWEEMRFEFVAKEMLHITFRKQTRRFEPADLKMQNKNTLRPNLQWSLLGICDQGLYRTRSFGHRQRYAASAVIVAAIQYRLVSAGLR